MKFKEEYWAQLSYNNSTWLRKPAQIILFENQLRLPITSINGRTHNFAINSYSSIELVAPPESEWWEYAE